jgi:signal transduction histidine kinase
VAVELEAVTNELAGVPPASIANLRHLRKRVTECVREARESIGHLRSTVDRDQDLRASMQRLVESLAGSRGVACTVNVVGTYQPCAPAVEEQLLRIAQEAVSNALRHGEAKKVAIDLEYQEDSVVLAVKDDGRGFNSAGPGFSFPGHWGIASMRERAALVGGSFNIYSDLGGGTHVVALVPFQVESGRG